jgi:DNA-binding response OmpR family regulator
MTTKILYIEDDIQQLELVRIVVGKEGFQVFTAPDGMSGLALAQLERPAMVLMDVNLPGINGIEAAQQMRMLAGLEQVPIIALTSNMKLNMLQPHIGTLFNAYIQKPVLRKDLLACISAHMRETSR